MGKLFSIIIPVYNGEKTISECLSNIQNMDFDKSGFEVIVVDNNSTDHTREILKKFDVTCLIEKKQGASSARNCGAKYAKGEILCFLDADCIVGKDWLAKIEKHFKNDKTTALVGFCVHQKKNLADAMYIYEYNLDWEQRYCLNNNKMFALTGANSAVRKDVFMEMGGFDESFLALDDVDLGLRLIMNGYSIIGDKSLAVFHNYTDVLQTRLKKTINFGYDEHKMYSKHDAEKVAKYMPSFNRIHFRVLNRTHNLFFLKGLIGFFGAGVAFLNFLLNGFMLVKIKNHKLYRFLLNTAIFKGKLIALLEKCEAEK